MAVLTIMIPWYANACPSCYGAPDSPMTAGMNSAILVMLGIISLVLSAIGGAFVYLWRRALRLGVAVSGQTCLHERGEFRMNNEKGVVE